MRTKLPVENVETSVQAKEQHIMSCDVFNISQFVDHVQLGKNCKGFKPNAERP